MGGDLMESETLWWPLEPPGKKPKTPPIPKAPPMPREVDISEAKTAERRRLRRMQGTKTLFTENWLQEPGITQMRLSGA